MVLHLNPFNFSRFGSILPERTQAASFAAREGQRTKVELDLLSCPVFLAQSDTWVRCIGGTAVISASTDGEPYYDFYLDKPVCVKAGITFCLGAFMDTGVAELVADVAPKQISSQERANGFQATQSLRIDSLYTFFYHEKEQGFFFAGESHPMLELTYVDQGSMHSVADGQDLFLEQGDMVFYGPNQWHMQYSDIGVAPRYVTVSFSASGVDLTHLLNRKFQPPQKVVTLLKMMLHEQEQPDSYSVDAIINLLSLILLTLLRDSHAPSVKLKTAYSLHNENEIIRRAQQYISANIRQKLSVPLVARNVDVSPSYLTALFHKNLQISPGEYIRRIKLQESKQMIRENNMNFTEIAAALQYSTVHHFSRQFKEKFGITPTEYAKSVR